MTTFQCIYLNLHKHQTRHQEVYYSGTIIGKTIHQDIGNGGLRSGTLMPMISYFNANTTKTLKYYYVCANMMSSSGVQYTNDDLTFMTNTQQIKITEIKI